MLSRHSRMERTHLSGQAALSVATACVAGEFASLCSHNIILHIKSQQKQMLVMGQIQTALCGPSLDGFSFDGLKDRGSALSSGSGPVLT